MVAKRLGEYLEAKNISFYAFENALNVSRGSISKAVKEDKNIGSNVLENILTLYKDINPIWLLTGDGNMTREEVVTEQQPLIPETASEVMVREEKLKKSEVISIPIVEIYAAAGQGYMNTENLIPTGEVNLPKAMFRASGLRYCVRVKGFSMSPTLQDSDLLIIRHLDPREWSSMPDEHVYLIVDKDGMAYVKRVKNRLDRGFVVLTSDSIEKSSYPNFNLQADEIANVFYAEWHFSAKMQNINETYYDRLKSLEDRFDNFENMIKIEHKK